ncbi:ester cyclase [Haladaptatus sp. NG-SE-30]
MSQTTATEVKERMRRGMNTIWNDRNLRYIDDQYAEDFVMHDIAEGQDIEGKDAYKEYVTDILTAFSDFEVWPEDIIIGDENKAVVRYTWRGTHTGPFDGIEPTGRTVETSGVAVFRSEGEELAEAWFYDDMFGIFRQLGLLPEEFDQ